MAADDSESNDVQTMRARQQDAPEDREHRDVATVLLDEYDEINMIETMRVGKSAYVAISGRGDSLTAHRVDVDEFVCSCPDKTYNRQGGEVCAHLARCLLDHAQLPFEERRTDDRVDGRLDELVEEIEDLRETIDDLDVDDLDEGADEGNGEPTSTDRSSGSDPIQVVNDWLNSHQCDPEDFRVYRHDDLDRVVIETESVPEEDYRKFVKECQQSDFVEWEDEEQYNWVKPSDTEAL
jgi:hypothetical protein